MAATETKVDIFMPLYVSDYDRDTAELSFEEHGFYLAILRSMWSRGGCLKLAQSSASSTEQASDKQRIARILRTDVETFERIWPSVERFFVFRSNGEFFQKRLMFELAKAKRNKEFAVDRARKGGEGKAAKAAQSSASSTSQADLEAVPKAVLDVCSSPSPSDSGSSISLLVRSSPPDQTRSNESASLGPFHERPRVYMAACTIPFMSVYDRYPRKEGKQPAAQVFQEIAETYPGGEAALASAILIAFDAGMLRAAPYSGPNKTRPMLDRFLAQRRWEDAVSAPDDVEPLKPSKPWLAADKAAERARGADRAASRLAQQELDRLVAGEKAVG